MEAFLSRSSFTPSLDGTVIAFDFTGSGPNLILIEPAGHFRGMSAYEELVPLLEDQFTVVRYDRRGRGESTDVGHYHPQREVEDLGAVITAIGGTPLVYGYSSGALLALHAAAAGSAMSGLVLMEPPLQPEDQQGPDPLTAQLDELATAGRYEEAVELFHTAIGVPHEIIDDMRSTERWRRMVGVAPTLVYDCRLSDALNTAELRTISIPTLVLDSNGSIDDLTGSAAKVAGLLANAHHKSLPGEWHVVSPDLVAMEIVKFFDLVSSPQIAG